jgi:2',3'-cyclic-nucleotide 2'-phosphodiesterase (5'-nucleotidase family)
MRLRIVSFNDVYSLENMPRMKTLVRACAAREPADICVVVLAGDFLAPSILSSLDAGRGMVECVNAVGVTHAVLGNHEDDVPLEALQQRLRELDARVIATNVRGFDGKLLASDVIEAGGVRVGIVGVVMNDSAVYRRPPFGGAEILDPNAAAMREAARLASEERCACVIAITHQAMEADRALARDATRPPFPVIVGGHEHIVEIEQVGATWIVKAGTEAEHAAIVDMEVDARGAKGVRVRLEDSAKYEEDAALRARVDVHMKRVHDLETATLAVLAPDEVVSSIGARARQTSFGSLVCSRVRDALGADACLFNGGGIRASREYRGRITYGEIKAEVPFDNEVVLVRMPGSVVRDSVAASRAHAPNESGGFLQVDDRMIVLEPSHAVVAIAGKPIDPAREYRVAVVRDMMLGMDHNEPLTRFAREQPERVPPEHAGREIKTVLVDALSVALWTRLGGFEAIDADGDGNVTELEIAQAVARATNDAPSPITAGLVMNALDADHDHAISRDEAYARTPKKPLSDGG